MGDLNQFYFVKNNVHLVTEPVLEVGSKDYGNTPDFRSLFPNYEYIGVDMEEGKGVDIVMDLTDEFSAIVKKLENRSFGTVICFSVLEHCKHPFKMCDNISRLLKNEGLLFVSVPFSWKIHGYPSDYWRFTPDGIKVLFPECDFDVHAGELSTCQKVGKSIGRTEPINTFMMRVDLMAKQGLKYKHYGHLTAAFIKLCRKFRLMPQIFDYPLVFPPVTINMIGVKIGNLNE